MVRCAVFVFACVILSGVATGQERGGDRLERILSLPADLSHGRAVYSRDCASCHGAAAQGDAERSYPALAGQWPNYLLRQLTQVIETDRVVPEMHRLMARWQFEDPQTLRDVATHLAALDPVSMPQRGDGQRVAEGRQVYEAECAACHGRAGEGDNPSSVPALRGQHFGYLRSQMRSLATGHRNGMDGEGRERLLRLSQSQLEAVADHLSRLPADR